MTKLQSETIRDIETRADFARWHDSPRAFFEDSTILHGIYECDDSTRWVVKFFPNGTTLTRQMHTRPRKEK